MLSQPWVKCHGLHFEGMKEALVGSGLGVPRLGFVLQSSAGAGAGVGRGDKKQGGPGDLAAAVQGRGRWVRRRRQILAAGPALLAGQGVARARKGSGWRGSFRGTDHWVLSP